MCILGNNLSTCVLCLLQRGLLGQLGHELNSLGRTISREIDWTADQINKGLATTAQGKVLVILLCSLLMLFENYMYILVKISLKSNTRLNQTIADL